MRLTSIIIQNYRQYKNFSADFRKNQVADLHLIIGSNGIGKTNILNAITWCLYGDEPHLGDSSRALSKLNIESRDEYIMQGKKVGIVEVAICAEDEKTKLKFTRKAEIDIESSFEYRSEFHVETTSPDERYNVKIHSGEEATAYVNKYMPEKIRQYFFFDGEQLDKYFITDARSSIRDSIYAISQVDIVTRIATNLEKVAAKKRKEANNITPKTGKLVSDIEQYKNVIAKENQSLHEREEQIERARKRVDEIDDFLRGQENLQDLEEAYQKLEKDLSIVEEEEIVILGEINDFIKKYYVALSFYPHAKQVLKVIQEKDQKGELPPSIDRNLLQKILKEHVCSICGHSLTAQEEEKIKKLINQFQISSSTSHLLMEIKGELVRIVNLAEEYTNSKNKMMDKYRNNKDKKASIQTNINKIDKKVSQFSDKELVRSQYSERSSLKKAIQEASEQIGSIKARLIMLNTQTANMEEALNKEMVKQKTGEKLANAIELAKKAKAILQEIEKELMDDIRLQIEERTMKYFENFIWKKGTYKSVKLDENYQLELFHINGDSCVGSCGAAERSLLALSFTIALHEVSGFGSLLFIDTPVARVSDTNRKNFANILKQVSSNKQIIMTLTPDEYSQEVREVFDPVASTRVRLSMQNERTVELEEL